MELMTAITYPFKNGNVKPTIMTPAIVYLVGIVIALIIGGGVFFGLMTAGMMDENPEMTILLCSLAIIPVSIVVMAPIAGFTWALTGVWMHQGFEAPAPTWSGNMMNYTKSGFHLMLIGLIMVIPSALVSLSLGLLAPFFITPFLLASQERTVGAYFRYFPKAIGLAKKHYFPLLIATYVSLVLLVGYYIVMIGLGMTVIGNLIINVPMTLFQLAAINLFIQQLGIHGQTQGSRDVFGDTNAPKPSKNTPSELGGMMVFPSIDLNQAQAAMENGSAPTEAVHNEIDTIYQSAAPSDFSLESEAINDTPTDASTMTMSHAEETVPAQQPEAVDMQFYSSSPEPEPAPAAPKGKKEKPAKVKKQKGTPAAGNAVSSDKPYGKLASQFQPRHIEGSATQPSTATGNTFSFDSTAVQESLQIAQASEQDTVPVNVTDVEGQAVMLNSSPEGDSPKAVAVPAGGSAADDHEHNGLDTLQNNPWM